MRETSPRRLGRYRVIRRIGEGGAGEVYLCEMEGADGFRRLSALKVLRRGSNGSGDRAALLREARLAASLSHPNLVPVWEVGGDGEIAWLAMEFVAGRSLLEVLAAAGAGLPPLIAARIIADVCSGVHALHEAIDERGRSLSAVHRDLTPHNVLLSWTGLVKVVDLGLARFVSAAAVTRSGIVKGKLSYLSPEQASGEPLDRRSDVFALGILLWEAVTGRRLFLGGTDSETLAIILRGHAPSLLEVSPPPPAGLAEVAARALAHHPADRYPSAREMQRDLEASFARGAGGVGPDELAGFLQRLFPDGVREHERWLRHEDQLDAGGPEPAPPVTAEVLELAPPAASAIVPSRRPRRLFLLGAALGALASVVALAAWLGRSYPSPGLRRADGASGLAERVVARAPVPAPDSPDPRSSPVGAPGAARASSTQVIPTATPPPPLPVILPDSGPRRQAARARAQRQEERASAAATLNLVSSPSWARIRLDGQDVGATPLVLHDVGSGRHVVEAIALGVGPRQTRTIVAEPLSVTRVEFQFGESEVSQALSDETSRDTSRDASR